VIDDVLYGAAGWLLTGVAAAWFFSRAAQCLRQPPPSPVELPPAACAHAEDCRGQHPGVLDAGALAPAVSAGKRV
jgi:hypothetical protein